MKIAEIKNYKTVKELKTNIEKEGFETITGTISELKRLKLTQDSEVYGVKVKPEPEEVDLSKFRNRQELDDYVKGLLGDNLTLNRLNRHSLKGTLEDLNRLLLGEDSQVYGCRVEKI